MGCFSETLLCIQYTYVPLPKFSLKPHHNTGISYWYFKEPPSTLLLIQEWAVKGSTSLVEETAGAVQGHFWWRDLFGGQLVVEGFILGLNFGEGIYSGANH